MLEVDGPSGDDGGDGVLVDHLGDCVSQQDHVLIKGLDLTLQLDAVDQINRHRYMLAAQCVEKGILQKLTFVIAHDIFRVQKWVDKTNTLPQPETVWPSDQPGVLSA